MAQAPRDSNFVTTLLAVSSADGITPVTVYADPTTHRLLVDSASGSGDVSGPGSSTQDALVRWDNLLGTLVADSTVTLSDAGILAPVTSDTAVLGSTTKMWSDLFLASGGVINWNSDMTITHAADNLTFAGGTVNLGTATAATLLATTSVAFEETGAGTDTITLQAPASITASYTLTLPVDDGDANEVLVTNGSGVLSWEPSATPSVITVANEATDTSCFIAFFTAATGDLQPKTNVNMIFDSSTGVATFASTVLTTTDINGGTIDNTVIGGATAAAATVTTLVVNTSALPDADDGAPLGASGTAWSDLFLASGAVINWAAGDVTITHSSGLLTISDPVTVSGLVTGSGFEPTATTATGNRMYLPAANTLGFSINGTGELQLTGTALSPISDDGLALGTTALGWQSLFGDTGFVVNIENGNWVATHTSAILTVGTGDLRVTTAGTDATSVVTVGGTQTLTAKTLTAPVINAATLSGIITLAESTSIALDPAQGDGTWTGITRAGTAGATLAFGQLCYLAAADSRWELTDADSVTTADRMLGMCVLAAAADGDPTVMLLMGNIQAASQFPAMTIGSAMYIGDDTAGTIETAIPTGADNVIRRVGYALTADELYFNPSMDSQTTVA